ncbi:response regulator transcription factor [Novosphingobium profundi]|uniref:LuxR C-terminal-related transcriptional regulator n=1 Tax=Novosphingobium profundi TaxID=1774954 RepID=UPI001BDA0342|nr:response regulator transcription factor [Novosphingobium profundi]MBT0667230.1 response regulator transcription factor [Novosphingobium profundi]
MSAFWVARNFIIWGRRKMSSLYPVVGVSIIGFTSIIREGIGKILEGSEFSCSHFFASCADALDDEHVADFDLAILDLAALDGDIDSLQPLKECFPDLRIAAFVDNFDFGQMVEAFNRGVDAYLLKEIASDPLLGSLRLVHQGEKVMPSALLEHLAHRRPPIEGEAEVKVELGELLSEREIDTLHCLVMGYPNKVIAYRLDISEATVKVHVKAILRKLMVQNRTQAAIWAVNQGLVLPSTRFTDAGDIFAPKEADAPMVAMAN